MISQPLVSVVLASYNGEKYIGRQLESIAAQTYQNLEIIIRDDHSTDRTQDILQNFALQDNRVCCIFNEHNEGYNKNFREAFSSARGEFIAVADQDDIWLPEKIEAQLKLFTADDILLVHSASIRFSGNELPREKKISAKMFEGSDVLKLALRNSVSGHNMMFRTSLLKTAEPFPDDTFYDWWLAQTAAATGIVAASPAVHVYQRAHERNVTIKARTTKLQTEEEYRERKAALDNFLRIKNLKAGDRSVLTALRGKYLLLENADFSEELFKFYMQHRERLFYYKKGLPAYFSQRKHAKRMSSRSA